MRVVIVTPNEADRALSVGFLRDEGIDIEAYPGMAELAQQVGPGVGCIVLVEEALAAPELEIFHVALAMQPPWSDMPLLVIGAQGSSLSALVESVFPLSGNVTILQRPLHPLSLISAVKVALRARQRQYQIRDLIAEREQAVRHRDEFLAMLAHELRNPLAPIRNAVHLLGSLVVADPRFHKWREMIGKQTRHITRLDDDLLDVSRLERVKEQPRRQRMDVNEAFARSVQPFVPVTGDHRHAVTARTAAEPLVVDADPVRIDQENGHLIVYAAKFTPV